MRQRKAEHLFIQTGRSSAAREARLRYLYQSLILSGKARISLGAAKRLIGPDRAFHLYILPSRGSRPRGR